MNDMLSMVQFKYEKLLSLDNVPQKSQKSGSAEDARKNLFRECFKDMKEAKVIEYITFSLKVWLKNIAYSPGRILDNHI